MERKNRKGRDVLLAACIVAGAGMVCSASLAQAAAAVERPAAVCDQPDREAAPDADSMAARPARLPAGGMPEGAERVVPLVVDVDPAGTVVNVSIEASSRSRAVDRAAMETARGWTYVPAVAGCRPVHGRVRVQVSFDPPL
ncbi:TonB family protein [Luteimonas sp. Y-2-2-4F]|nr:TonB family protein [Luteimonas sp. Y-2-2-4F]MCD9031162.1 TonB family protein [Luteimonas sp. Y-2-2-4F]